MKQPRELGYTVHPSQSGGTDNPNDQFLTGYKPTEYVDLEGEVPQTPRSDFKGGSLFIERETVPVNKPAPAPNHPVNAPQEFGKPGTKSEFAEQMDESRKNGFLPRQFVDEKGNPLVAKGAEKKPADTVTPRSPDEPRKVITNITEESQPASVSIEQKGTSYPQDFSDPSPDLHGYSLVDFVSGPIPYMFLEDYKNGIRIRPINPIDAARISNAVKGKSLPALFDALSHTISVPYRYLTIADHVQIMYWHMYNSYPTEAFSYRWRSIYNDFGNVVETKNIKQTRLVETKLQMTESQFREYHDQGLDFPRVFSLDISDTLRDMEKTIESMPQTNAKQIQEYNTAKDEVKTFSWLLRYMQCISVSNPAVVACIAKRGHSPVARTKGIADYFAQQKDLTLIKRINEFLETIDLFGAKEVFTHKIAESLNVTQALTNLYGNKAIDEANKSSRFFAGRESMIDSEIERLEALRQAEIDRMNELHAKIDAQKDPDYVDEDVLETFNKRQNEIEIALNALTFEPMGEEVMVIRDPWNFFPAL